MSDLLPVQWKESLERIKDKAGHILDKFKQTIQPGSQCESITEEILPSFMQIGSPPMDMNESADELIITAEVPGLTKDDFTVELTGNRMVIRGEKKISRKRQGYDGSYLSECSYGRFARSVQLPYEVHGASTKADLKNGLLTIRIPKPDSERKRLHRIPIT